MFQSIVKPFLVSLLLLTCYSTAVAQESEATVNKEFYINADYAKVVSWVQKNPRLIGEHIGIKVVEVRQDGTIKVSRNTRRGTFVWVMREQSQERDGTFIYTNNLVESVQGGIVASQTYITLKPSGRGTTVSVEIYAKVDNPRVRPGEMRIDFRVSISRAERLLVQYLEPDAPLRPIR